MKVRQHSSDNSEFESRINEQVGGRVTCGNGTCAPTCSLSYCVFEGSHGCGSDRDDTAGPAQGLVDTGSRSGREME